MKSFSKISYLVIAAAFMSTAMAADIKPLRYQPPVKSQFVEKVAVKPAVTCAACEEEYVPSVTQDTKLKTKTVMVAKHGCADCKTTIVRTGAQKATGKVTARHSCGALIAAVETCCAGMK
jgi:hypothetical protein